MRRITGYSIGTISRAFNQTYPINPATRELILKTAKEIGYVPHSGARNLTQGRAYRWGLLLPDLNNPRFAEVMDHLDREARARNIKLLLGLSRYDPEMEAELAAHWASGEVDGIFVGVGTPDITVFEQLRNRKFPIVFLFGQPSPKFHGVANETTAARKELMEKLISAGHTRIGFVNHESDWCRIHPSYVTYRSALEAHGIPFDESLAFFGTRQYTSGTEAWAHWRKTRKFPTAVVCYNDVMACEIIRCATADGCRVPEDLSIVGSDDTYPASLCGLTTIRTDPAEMARHACEILENGSSRKAEVRVVHGAVVERRSIAKAPSKPFELPANSGPDPVNPFLDAEERTQQAASPGT